MTVEQYFRPTKAIIDLEAIRQNVRNLKAHIQPTTRIIAVVKANAYGHGDVAVAGAALEAGATMLAVATADEALHIRKHYPHTDILVLGATPVHFAPYAAEQRITLTVFSPEWVEQAARYVDTMMQPLKLHIKVDSGMGRIGVRTVDELKALEQAIVNEPTMTIDGIFTHFATADEENASLFTKQVQLFIELVNALTTRPPYVHASNTAAALIKDQSVQFDAVRYGISLYGLTPSSYVSSIEPFALQPALSLQTELVHVKEIQAGDSVGYGATFVAEESCWIGTLPIGYADGMIRKLGGQEVLIDGQRMPIVGRICMDQCMVLLRKKYPVGEPVQLIGKQGNEAVTLDEWAARLQTINYEVPCNFTNRIPRFYK
ncbi:alanine racemase [Caryophanon latum]|uniref:Alanine racemase n=1 Tax=Caryophanon latum TaxID=33977 RepID=A0A1C0Z4L8_9BACL|nr:alanine racemase [Caryophanon latum]OCS94405.1 alanine racemase [Caryophanon latum]